MRKTLVPTRSYAIARLSRSLVAVVLVFSGCAMLGCERDDDEKKPGAAVELIPTSASVIETCKDELGRTYCSEADANAAAQACTSKLSRDQLDSCDTGRPCIETYSPSRSGTCQEGAAYPTPSACTTPVADNCAFYRACAEES